MMRIAHLINPFYPAGSGDLLRVQEITLATMQQARKVAAGQIEVAQLAACYAEDVAIVPPGFQLTRPLTRSILDFHQFQRPRRLPLLADVLARGFESSTAEFMIFSNSDIALQPRFYLRVAEIATAGHDAFVINRRTISKEHLELADIHLMQNEAGRPHRGWDCFVFRRRFVPHFITGNVFIGAPRSGLVLLANLEALGVNFREFANERLTFHLGDDRAWSEPAYADYAATNSAEAWRVLAQLEAQHGRFPTRSITGSVLRRKRVFGPLYEAWSRRALLPADLARRLNKFLRSEE